MRKVKGRKLNQSKINLRLLLMLFLTVLTINNVCAQNRKLKFSLWEKLEFKNESEEGDISKQRAWLGNQPFTGRAAEYWPVPEDYPARKMKPIKRKATFKNGYLDGAYLLQSPTGLWVQKETYKNGQKNGPFEYYDEFGSLEFRGTYNENEEFIGLYEGFFLGSTKLRVRNYYVNGKLDSLCVEYYQTGQIQAERWFDEGTPIKQHKTYYENGDIASMVDFDNNGYVHGRWYEFHRTGCPGKETYYKHGAQDSISRSWDAITCDLIKTGNWENGKKEGVFVEYNQFMDTILAESYKNGALHGLHTKYAIIKDKKENVRIRTVETQGYYENGVPEGYWVYNMNSHFRQREGAYKDGHKIGLWKYYDIHGELLLTQVYSETGEKIKEKIHD